MGSPLYEPRTDMKAFVKTTNGTFPNVNFYLAWEAFNTLGPNRLMIFSERKWKKNGVDKNSQTV
jgi:hypothetical protein